MELYCCAPPILYNLYIYVPSDDAKYLWNVKDWLLEHDIHINLQHLTFARRGENYIYSIRLTKAEIERIERGNLPNWIKKLTTNVKTLTEIG